MNDVSTMQSRFTPINDAEPACDRTCAQLLIYSSELKPKEITDFLKGIEPTAQVLSKQPEGEYPGRANGWFLSSENFVNSKDLRTHLDWLLKMIAPRAVELTELQAREGVKMYVYCPWWAKYGGGGPSIWPEQMKMLSALNLECTIDFADYSEQEAGLSSTEDAG
jgi:Domain of unknown function (DUF4279)